MKLVFSSAAFRQLSKLERSAQKRIIEKLSHYLSQQNPLAFAEKITDPQYGEWRFRIGDYRVLFDVSGGTINVLQIGHRKDIYG